MQCIPMFSDRRIFTGCCPTRLTGWPSGGGERMSRVGEVHRRNTGRVHRELPCVKPSVAESGAAPTHAHQATSRARFSRHPLYVQAPGTVSRQRMLVCGCRCPEPLFFVSPMVSNLFQEEFLCCLRVVGCCCGWYFVCIIISRWKCLKVFCGVRGVCLVFDVFPGDDNGVG